MPVGQLYFLPFGGSSGARATSGFTTDEYIGALRKLSSSGVILRMTGNA